MTLIVGGYSLVLVQDMDAKRELVLQPFPVCHKLLTSNKTEELCACVCTVLNPPSLAQDTIKLIIYPNTYL